MSLPAIHKKQPPVPFAETISSHLECPISHDHMQDPVLLKNCGHTFDRPEITPWLEQREHCPTCMQKASINDMVTNFKVKDLTEEVFKYKQTKAHLREKAQELSVVLFNGASDHIRTCQKLFSLTPEKISSLASNDSTIVAMCKAALELDSHDIYRKIQSMQEVPQALLERLSAFRERVDIRGNKEVARFIGELYKELNNLKDKLAQRKEIIIANENSERANKIAERAKKEAKEAKQSEQEFRNRFQRAEQELDQANQRTRNLEGRVKKVEIGLTAAFGIGGCLVGGPLLGATAPKLAYAKGIGHGIGLITGAGVQYKFDVFTKIVNLLEYICNKIVALLARLGLWQAQEVRQ